MAPPWPRSIIPRLPFLAPGSGLAYKQIIEQAPHARHPSHRLYADIRSMGRPIQEGARRNRSAKKP